MTNAWYDPKGTAAERRAARQAKLAEAAAAGWQSPKPPEPVREQTFEDRVTEAWERIEVGVADVQADFPDVADIDVWHDVAESVLLDYGHLVRDEVRRRLYGAP